MKNKSLSKTRCSIKILLLLTISILVMAGCQKELSSPENLSSDMSIENTLGYSFRDLAVKPDLSNYSVFIDPNKSASTQVENQITVWNGNRVTGMGSWNNILPTILRGNYTFFAVVTGVPNQLDASYVPLMFLQTFKKSEYGDNFNFTMGGKNYTLSDLEEWVMFEDSELIMIDFRYLITGLTLQEYLKVESVNEGVAADYFDWMTEIYDYFKDGDNFKITEDIAKVN